MTRTNRRTRTAALAAALALALAGCGDLAAGEPGDEPATVEVEIDDVDVPDKEDCINHEPDCPRHQWVWPAGQGPNYAGQGKPITHTGDRKTTPTVAAAAAETAPKPKKRTRR